MYSRISSRLLPVDFRHCSNSVLAFTLASPSAICTRLWAFTSPSPEVSIGQEDHVLKFVDHRRLHSIGLRRRHAAKRLQRQHHVAELVHGVVNVLAYFKVSLAASGELVVERVSHFGQLCLRHQVMRDATHVLDGAVVEIFPRAFPEANAPELLVQAEVVREILLEFIPFWIAMRTIHWPLRNRVRLWPDTSGKPPR